MLASEVSEGRTAVAPKRVPAWRRYYLDFVALALSGLIYWLTIRTGFSAVISPDSNPTLSLSVYMFFGPALLWIGATLLLVRLRGRFMSVLARRAAGKPGSLGSLVVASLGRRASAVNRGLVVIGLLLAFAVSLGIFTATYNQQANVDAQLTLGADVTVTSPPGVAASSDLPAKVASVPGVTATTPVNHSYAYVGPDLQDTFGVDPAHFRGRHQPARLLLHRRLGRPDDEPARLDPRRHPGFEGDDHRLLAAARGPCFGFGFWTRAPAGSASRRST